MGIGAASYQLASSSGDLTLDVCGGPLELRTVSGKIEIGNASGAELKIETSGGRVNFSGSLDAQGDHWIKSVSGDVRLVLPADTAFEHAIGRAGPGVRAPPEARSRHRKGQSAPLTRENQGQRPRERSMNRAMFFSVMRALSAYFSLPTDSALTTGMVFSAITGTSL